MNGNENASPKAAIEAVARVGVIKGQQVTVAVRTSSKGLTEYWEFEGGRWVPVVSAEQVKKYGAAILGAPRLDDVSVMPQEP